MAVLPPDATEETPFMLLEASPTALKSWGGYASTVARAMQRPPYAVITEIDIEVEGDAFAPTFGPAWTETARERHVSATGMHYSFVTLQRTESGK